MCAAVRERKKTLSNTRSYTAIPYCIYLLLYKNLQFQTINPVLPIFNLNLQLFSVLKFHRGCKFFRYKLTRVWIDIDIILKENNDKIVIAY